MHKLKAMYSASPRAVGSIFRVLLRALERLQSTFTTSLFAECAEMTRRINWRELAVRSESAQLLRPPPGRRSAAWRSNCSFALWRSRPLWFQVSDSSVSVQSSTCSKSRHNVCLCIYRLLVHKRAEEQSALQFNVRPLIRLKGKII